MENGDVQENILEIGIDEYLDYELRMQLLTGAKKNEKAKYEIRLEDDVCDAASFGGVDSDYD